MEYQERYGWKPMNGFVGLLLSLILVIGGLAGGAVIFALSGDDISTLNIVAAVALIIIGSLSTMLFAGIKVVNPNEAIVLSLFGKYYGTIKESGFYFVNPFAAQIFPSDKNEANVRAAKPTNAATGTTNVNLTLPKKKVSLKVITHDNGAQKVNDLLGNPIEISAIVNWKVVNPTQAVINVDNFFEYLSSQTDSTIRNVARLYPYDIIDDNLEPSAEEATLRGSAMEIAARMKEELQERVNLAGIEIIDVRLNQIAYASEIAAAMLQRQQAYAIIAARQKIVEGAVSMVEMALNELKAKDIVELDPERKAQMVSNLLVVLCGNKDAQPIVNSGSIY